MSVNLLLLDEPKPWCNVRVNDLKIDGSLSVDGDEIAAITYVSQIQGSFVVTPFSSQVVASKIGAQVSMTIRAFNVLNANQSGSGNLDYFSGLPASWLPTNSMGFVIPFRDPNGGTIVSRLQYDAPTQRFEFWETTSSRTIFKAGGDVGLGNSDITISWVRF